MKRREFLWKGCLIPSAGLLLGESLLFASGNKSPVLVFLFLRGGVDQLSFLPPLEDPEYFKLRKATALSKASPRIKLSDPFFLHPSAKPLLELWKNKNLAFAVGAGVPVSVRSHSDAESCIESGTGQPASFEDGFLYRALGQLKGKAIALQSTTPCSLMGPKEGVLALGNLADFELKTEGLDPACFEALYEETAGSIRTSTRAAFRSIEDLKPIRGASYHEFVRSFPQTGLGRKLGDIAWLIRNRADIPIYATEQRGWDTHAGQGVEGGHFDQLVSELSGAIAAFGEKLGQDWGRTVVVALTEFGRTAAENECQATDHGHGSLAIVAGGAVRGGRILGPWRGLGVSELFEERDLPVTTDFREILSEVLVEHLRIRDLARVLPGFRRERKLGLFA